LSSLDENKACQCIKIDEIVTSKTVEALRGSYAAIEK